MIATRSQFPSPDRNHFGRTFLYLLISIPGNEVLGHKNDNDNNNNYYYKLAVRCGKHRSWINV